MAGRSWKQSFRVVVWLCLTTLICLPPEAVGCLWDYDTLAQERSRFPTALELMTGKFNRHSQAFYEWRIQDRIKKIQANGPTAEWLDDLAVAYDKVGKHDKAIQTTESAEKLFPGRYESAANLGTFYFHSQQLTAGIPHIERALQINPNAHFGREKYQLLLVKYVQSKQTNGKTQLPLAAIDKNGAINEKRDGFAEYILRNIPDDQVQAELKRAVQGILGMMRFGKYDSPILLEALGDLLAINNASREEGEQQLAARAFLQAHYVTLSQPDVSASYRRRAEYAIGNQMGGTGKNGQMLLTDLESVFLKELNEAKLLSSSTEEMEKQVLTNNPDPEATLTRYTLSNPAVGDYAGPQKILRPNRELQVVIALGVVGAFFLVIIGAFIFGLIWYLRSRPAGRRSESWQMPTNGDNFDH